MDEKKICHAFSVLCTHINENSHAIELTMKEVEVLRKKALAVEKELKKRIKKGKK